MINMQQQPNMQPQPQMQPQSGQQGQQYYQQQGQAMQPQPVSHQPVAPMHQAAPPAKPKSKLAQKTQSPIFSTMVKALCLLILLAAFLPFGTVSCGPMLQMSVSGYDLALGRAAGQAEAFTDGGGGLGMGMGAGQLAALNMLAGVNVLLLIAFIGTALLFVLSIGLGRTRLELTFGLIVAAFSLAAYLQWLGIFSAFTGMFETAAERGGNMMSAGPDIGLYAVIAFSSLLLIAAGLEAIGKLPTFQSEEPDAVEPVPVSPGGFAPVPANTHYQPVPQPATQPVAQPAQWPEQPPQQLEQPAQPDQHQAQVDSAQQVQQQGAPN